jgi:hypothetical protein
MREKNIVTKQDDPRFSKFEELEELRGQVFENESDLLEAMEQLELCYLKVILGDDGKAYVLTSSDNHDGATSAMVSMFLHGLLIGKVVQPGHIGFLWIKQKCLHHPEAADFSET